MKNNLYSFLTKFKKWDYLILFVILLLSLWLRVYRLDTIPLGFHNDEASLGYNAYSLLLTGKDSNGSRLPLYVNMFNDYNPSGYYYLAAVSIKLLGLNEFATRLPAALAGAFCVLAIYLLGLAIFQDKKISLLSAFFVAIAPWNVVLSRTSAETMVALFFVILGFALIIFNLRNRSLKFLLAGTLSLLLSFFIYPAPRVFVPLFYLVLLIFFLRTWYKSSLKYKLSVIGSFLFLAVSSVILVFFISGGTSRFDQVSIFTFPETSLVKAEQIREDGVMGVSIPTTRLFHNKVVNYSLTFASNYFQYFTGDFLFIKGGLPLLLRVPNMGLVYIVELPFILWGVINLVKSKNKFSKIALLWLLVAPVVSAITVDDSPNVRRALVMFPAVEMIAAYGFLIFLENYRENKKIIVSLIFALFLVFNFAYFMHQYFIHAQINKNWYRNVGFKEMVMDVKASLANYDKVIVTKAESGVGIITLFYMQYDPATYQKEGSHQDKAYTGFGKFFFTNAFCPSAQPDPKYPKAKKIIYVDDGTCPDSAMLGLKHTDIVRKDDTRVFRIVYD